LRDLRDALLRVLVHRFACIDLMVCDPNVHLTCSFRSAAA
jgi:hypothetical protein